MFSNPNGERVHATMAASDSQPAPLTGGLSARLWSSDPMEPRTV